MNWLEYHEEPVTLHSGDTSHWLVRADLIFEDERLRQLVLEQWMRNITYGWPYQIYGIPRGGTPWAAALANILPYSEHIHDLDQSKKGYSLIVIDDVVTTGNSLLSLGADYHLAVVIRNPILFGSLTHAWQEIALEPFPVQR